MIPAPRLTDLERFRAVVAAHLGLRFEDTRLAVLEEVLARRVEANPATAGAYLDGLEQGHPPREEMRLLAQALTVGETYFFRYMDQFRAFAEIVRPMRHLRVLSAGCASGEETYSLAMMVREHVAEPGARVAITGVDVNAASLARASRGVYSAWSLRETPPEMQRRWFVAAGRESIVDPSIRAAVRFEERNLADEEPGLWMPESYDVVFCRNVLMYLTPSCARALVARIHQALAPGGRLFLGHAETLRGLSQGFQLCQSQGTFHYQRKDASELAAGDADLVARPWPSPATPSPDGGWAARWIEAVQRSATRIQELSAPSGASPEGSLDTARGRAAPADLRQAFALLKNERFAEALEVLGDPPREASRDPDMLLLRAVLLTLSGRLDEAERVCKDLCVLDDLNAGAHYLLALCREGAGDAAGAAEHDRTAAYIDPGFAMPRFHLGLLARRGGDLRSARHEMQQALDLLVQEDPSRILLFGGGFTRDALAHLCQAELRAIGSAR